MQSLMNSIEFFFRLGFDQMRMNAAADGAQQFGLRVFHPLDVLLDVAARMKIQGPFQIAVDLVFDDDVVDDAPVVNDGFEFRFHQIRTVAADEDPRTALL